MHVRPATCACPVRVGLAITIYIRCIYGLFGRNITKYTVIYGVYIQFWPTLVIYGGTIVDGSYVFEMWVW